jgi:hypothetical protein
MLAACALLATGAAPGTAAGQVPAGAPVTETFPVNAPAAAARPGAPAAPDPSAERPASASGPGTGPINPGATPPPAPPPPSIAPTLLLIIPGPDTPFARAADALRQGFLSAHKADGGNRTVQVAETDESSLQVTAALKSARDRGVRVAVGPLTRAAVNALDNGSGLLVPLVTLNIPDWEAHAPPTLLAFSVGADSEVGRLVRVAMADPAVQRTGMTTAAQRNFLVVGGRGGWAQRVIAAFKLALVEAGELPNVLEPTFDTDGLQRFSQQVKGVNFDAVFLALDAREAALIRPRLARDVPIYGTSQVYAGEGMARTLAQELAGIRFADMPWLLEPDHPAVMIYPRPALVNGQVPDIESLRLYAMGIDAYRLAAEWASGRTRFEIDGVTGMLRVDRAQTVRVERLPSFAVYRGGRILREDPAR